MSAAIAAVLLPAHPNAALSLAAGQILAAGNFFFLARLVKLFTGAASAPSRASGDVMRAKGLFLAMVKLAVIYGGAFAVTRWRGVELLPLLGGLTMPLLALVLKATMLAFGAGSSDSSRRAPSTAAPLRGQAKLAATILLAGLLALPAFARAFVQESSAAPPAAVEQGSAAHGLPEGHDAAGTEVGATASEHGAAEHAEGGEEHGGGGEHLPNWITIANDYAPNNPIVHWMHANEYLVFAWLAGVLFLGLTWVGMRKPQTVPGQLQNAIEWIVESMEDVCGGMLGKHLPKYFPFIMAIFFYILMMNLIGIIPGLKSSTSTLDVTLALALVTFLYVQVSGLINLGPLGYIDHLAGSPRDVVGFAMLPVMIPVHILGELVKPVSLSCRLFGNIFGEDTLIVVFVGVAALCLKASLVALAVPPMAGITALFMLLQTLTAIVQALIFSLLTTVYLYMMLPHESHAHEEGGHAH
jgi:F-type H+-transporting ATPase subunit a